MSLPIRRLQQSIFEQAASLNRAAGSGGGSGFIPLRFIGQAVNNPVIVGLTYSEQASISFQPPYVGARFLFFANIAFTINDTVGDSEVITLTLDGDTTPNFNAPDYNPYVQTSSPSGTTNMPSQTAIWTRTMSDTSAHRVSLMLGKTGGTISQVYYTLYAFQMG